jgi:hypothetical protein
MLRAEFNQRNNGLVLKLEGRLVSAWAVQVKSLVSRHFVSNGFLVDMSEVTYVDSVGEQLLLWLRDLHAEFAAETCYVRDTSQGLHLPLKGDADRPVPSATEVHSPLTVVPLTRPGESGIARARPLKEPPNMACIDSTKRKTAGRKRQSTREILARFEDEREILSRLPRVITGDRGAAEQSVGETRGLVTNGAHPLLFREQLLQWLKWGTIKVAITNSLYEIACCESKYVNQNCTHSEHVLNGNDLKLGEFRSFLGRSIPKPSSPSLNRSPERSPSEDDRTCIDSGLRRVAPVVP